MGKNEFYPCFPPYINKFQKLKHSKNASIKSNTWDYFEAFVGEFCLKATGNPKATEQMMPNLIFKHLKCLQIETPRTLSQRQTYTENTCNAGDKELIFLICVNSQN